MGNPNFTWGTTPTEDVSRAYKAGVDMQNYKPQQEAETSLLSDKAEASKMALAAVKEQQVNLIQERAGLAQTFKEDPALKAETLSGQIEARKRLIKSDFVKNNPSLQQEIFKETMGLQKQNVDASIEAGKKDTADMERVSIALSSFFTNTANTSGIDALLSDDTLSLSQRKNLSIAKTMFTPGSIHPIPQEAGGDGVKTWDQYTQEEKGAISAKVLKGNEKLKDAQADTVRLSALIEREARTREQTEQREKDRISREQIAAAAQIAANERARIAAEKIETTNAERTKVAEAKLTSALGLQINKITNEQNKILSTYSAASVDEETENWWGTKSFKVPPAEQTVFQSLEQQKEMLQEQHKIALEALHTASPVNTRKTETWTTTQKDWIERAKAANPGLSEADIIAQGKKSKKL